MAKSEKDLETIITELLASSAPAGSRRKHLNAVGRRPANRHNTISSQPRKRRPPRNPLYTSLRLIIMGLVILLVPLLFSVKKIPPPKATITGALAHDPVVIVQLINALPG
jgi:hypothetical protein